jgi:NADH-quinone oxidoreductase subunit F
MGTPLHTIIYDIGGGIPDGNRLKAVQLGGPSGGCVPENLVETPVDYESIAKTGAIVGSGGMVVMDETSCMVDIAKFFLGFTAEESCGKCSPCREGTQQLLHILERITNGEGLPEDLDRLETMSRVLQNASLCGLGQTAANPVLSTLRYFRHEYEAHIYDKHCPTGVCKRLSAPPCQSACPVGQDAATYIALIGHREYEKAWEIIRRENPFPMVLGRICLHPCETQCKRGEVDDPITICALKRFVADRMRDNLKEINPEPVLFPEDKVAVIGAGPAGLTVAHDLALKGYPVTVFEQNQVAGGMLRTGIPEDRLPRDVVNDEINAIKRLGVEIRLGVGLGRDIGFQQLRDEGYKAFFLGVGAHRGLAVPIPGGIQVGWIGRRPSGLPYGRVDLGKDKRSEEKICVLGGGNPAVDTARRFKGLGAEEVHLVYQGPREQMDAAPDLIEEALEEGIQLHTLTSPVRITGNGAGVGGLACRKTEAEKEDGKGSEFVIECNLIIPSVYKAPDLSFMEDGARFEINRKNPITLDERTLSTNIPGLFAGGDAVTGPTTVVKAVAAGHRAAVSIDCYLRGREYGGYWYPKPHLMVDRLELTEEDEQLLRPKMIGRGLDESTALNEAKRCLRCDL